MANIDDEPAKFSELDLSEDSAITSDDVEEVLGVDEGSEVMPKTDADPTEEDAEAAEEA